MKNAASSWLRFYNYYIIILLILYSQINLEYKNFNKCYMKIDSIISWGLNCV